MHKHTKTQYEHYKTMYTIPIHSNSTLNLYNMLYTHWRYQNSKLTQKDHVIPQNTIQHLLNIKALTTTQNAYNTHSYNRESNWEQKLGN